MPHMRSRWFALLSGIAVFTATAATRPHYGGTLRVEVREASETADPPQAGRGLPDLAGSFTIAHWEAGRLAVYAAQENAPGGRPYLDSIEVQLGRPFRDQAIDLELGKVDVVELGPNEVRRSAANRKTWNSAPVRVLALVFGPRITDPRVREALGLAVDRSAIHNVLLQRQGEISGALLPQWISGYGFLFSTVTDINRARSLAAALPPSARLFSLGIDDPGLRAIADRIALNARDAGLAVSINAGSGDVRLVEARVESSDPARALGRLAAQFGLGEPARADSPETLYTAERALLDGFRVVPLFHLPDVYGVGNRVKGGPGITPMGEWRFGDLWVEGSRP